VRVNVDLSSKKGPHGPGETLKDILKTLP
jgi:hypothetical protein